MVPREAYDVPGDLYAEVYGLPKAIAFRPFQCALTIREWTEKRFGPLPDLLSAEGLHPWLEFPFKQNPRHHHHFNIGNIHTGDPEYYFVVTWVPNESGKRKIIRSLLFIPSRSSKHRVRDHLEEVFGPVQLYGLSSSPDSFVLPAAA